MKFTILCFFLFSIWLAVKSSRRSVGAVKCHWKYSHINWFKNVAGSDWADIGLPVIIRVNKKFMQSPRELGGWGSGVKFSNVIKISWRLLRTWLCMSCHRQGQRVSPVTPKTRISTLLLTEILAPGCSNMKVVRGTPYKMNQILNKNLEYLTKRFFDAKLQIENLKKKN